MRTSLQIGRVSIGLSLQITKPTVEDALDVQVHYAIPTLLLRDAGESVQLLTRAASPTKGKGLLIVGRAPSRTRIVH